MSATMPSQRRRRVMSIVRMENRGYSSIRRGMNGVAPTELGGSLYRRAINISLLTELRLGTLTR